MCHSIVMMHEASVCQVTQLHSPGYRNVSQGAGDVASNWLVLSFSFMIG